MGRSDPVKKIYAFVFARGGSKGLPRKNVLKLGNHPLIAHSILLAKSIPEITKVFVSTDDAEIKAIAQEYGAEVIDRPAYLASDTAAEWDAWRHAVNSVTAEGNDFDLFVSLPATSPLRSREDVLGTLSLLDEDTDAVITVTPAARSPFFNMVRIDESGNTTIFSPTENATRRQDVPEVYDITTVAYITKPDFILTNDRLFSGRVKAQVVPKERAIDIDDVYDFNVAQMLLNKANEV